MGKDALVIDGAVRAEPVASTTMDESSFQTLYRQTATPLTAYVTRVLGEVGHTEDIVQEAYLRLLRAGPATDDPSYLRAFLFRVASRLMVDLWRRRRRERGAPDNRTPQSTVPAPNVPLRLDFVRVFKQLDPQQRQMLWLAYVEGADHREIAAALGVRERSVRVLLYRARRKLARLVKASDNRQGERG
jgi:RNA polymerase sigma-70 factor (ECF subfamily)